MAVPWGDVFFFVTQRTVYRMPLQRTPRMLRHLQLAVVGPVSTGSP